MRIVLILMLISPMCLADCSFEKSIAIAFRSAQATDVLTSRVVAGEDCSKGFEHITIMTSEGRWLYEYYAPLRHYFRDPITRSDVVRVVENNLDKRNFSLTNELPIWMEPQKFYETNLREISVSKEQYESYQTQSWVTYTHQVGYEGFKTIVFDREANLVREVMGGGP